MRSINSYITEKLIIKKKKPSVIKVETKEELQRIIKQEMNNQGYDLNLTHIDVSAITDLSELLYPSNSDPEFEKIRSIDITGWDVSNVKSCDSMFLELRNVKEIYGFGNLNFKNCETFHGCFDTCNKLEIIEDIENLKIPDCCERLSFMFALCYGLTELKLNKWNTKNIEWFSGIFHGCVNLTNLEIDEWDVSKGFSMSSMFYRCESLKQLDLSKWNITKRCKTIDKLFAYCNSLETIGNINSWDISHITNYEHLFYWCKKLKLNTTDWIFAKKAKTTGMFAGTNSKILIRNKLK